MLEAPTPQQVAQKGKQAQPKLLPSGAFDSMGNAVPSRTSEASGLISGGHMLAVWLTFLFALMMQLISSGCAGAASDTIHVCDAVECKLPAEDWFESSGAANRKKQGT